MIYRQLGDTGLRVSVIGLGTHQFAGEWGHKFDTQKVGAILAKGQELGINLIDTAASYGDHLSEALIGRAVQPNRSNWIIATKFGRTYSEATGAVCDFSMPAVRSQLETSLKALRTDYIDLYQFHSGRNQDFDNDELWHFLNQQVRDGTIRCLGLSISYDLVASDDLHQLVRAREVGVGSVQIVYNRLVKKAEQAVLPRCNREGLGVVARVPLARGILSGSYDQNHVFPVDDYRARFSDGLNRELLREADWIKRNEVPGEVAMSEWALSWCLRNNDVDCVIPGCKDVTQVSSNARAVQLLGDECSP